MKIMYALGYGEAGVVILLSSFTEVQWSSNSACLPKKSIRTLPKKNNDNNEKKEVHIVLWSVRPEYGT